MKNKLHSKHCTMIQGQIHQKKPTITDRSLVVLGINLQWYLPPSLILTATSNPCFLF